MASPLAPLEQPIHLASTPFTKLPLEVLFRITDSLNTQSLGNLRLTCRSIEKALFHMFTREFFSKKQFMISSFSLQALVDMSRSRIADCMNHLIIGTDRYRNTIEPRSNLVQVSKYVSGRMDQQSLLWSGHALSMLKEAVARLPNLKVVGMRDYASDARKHRDGKGARWSSYGSTTVSRETGVNLLRDEGWSDSGAQFSSQIFALVLSAVAGAGSRPEAFEMLRHRSGALDTTAFHIPYFSEPLILPVLHNLKRVFLSIDTISSERNSISISASGSPADVTRCPSYPIRLFLGHLVGLRHLRLNFMQHLEASDLLAWLGSDAVIDEEPLAPSGLRPQLKSDNGSGSAPVAGLPRPPPPVSLPHLEQLDIGLVTVRFDTLLGVIQKLSPKKLELWKVVLKPSGVGDVNLWSQFFRKLRALPGLDLDHLMVGSLGQSGRPSHHGNIAHDAVSFRAVAVGPHRPPSGDQKRSYTGKDVKLFMDELAVDVQVNLRQPASPPSGEDGHEDDVVTYYDTDENSIDQVVDELLGEGAYPGDGSDDSLDSDEIAELQQIGLI